MHVLVNRTSSAACQQTLWLSHYTCQVMHILVNCDASSSVEAAAAAGAQVRVMVERVIKGLGPRFMAAASFNSLMLASEAAFLRLLDGDEVSYYT